MADAASATLPADMLSPVSNLEKDAAQYKSGLDSAEKGIEQAYQQKGEALKGEAAEIGKQKEDLKNFNQDHPFPHPDLKPWKEKPPENNPMQAFGSWASAFGILAGAVTKTGLASSLNASAAAINAFKKNDMDAYEEAKKSWKENTEVSIKNAEWEAKGYESALQLMEKDQAAGLAQWQATAAQADNQAAMNLAKINNLKEMWNMQKGLADFAAGGPERMLKLQELSTKMEDLKARGEMWKLWEQQHPGAAPEEQARARTAIMLPQYVINQAKTLGENQGGEANAPLPQEAVSYLAKQFRRTGVMPGMGYGKQGSAQRKQIYMEAAREAAEEGVTPGDDVASRAYIKSEAAALTNAVKQQEAIKAFEQTATANGKVALDLVDKVDSTGSPVLERWIRGGKVAIAGDPDVTAFNTQIATYTAEVAKILSNPNLTGVLSDSAREEAQQLVNKNFTAEQLHRVIPLLEQDFGRRQKSLDDEVKQIRGNIKEVADGPGASKDGPKTGSRENPIPVKSDEDYAKAPSGSYIVAPDGTVRGPKP